MTYVNQNHKYSINEIEATTKSARTIWYGLLFILIFIPVMLLGVEHADFYGFDRTAQLPFIGMAVPTERLFYVGPFLIAAIYCYFHFYAIRLWVALGCADAESAPHGGTGSRPLAQNVFPWQLTDAALSLRQKYNDDGSFPPRALTFFSRMISTFAAWWLGPVVLLLLWWNSLPARNWMMSSASVLALLFMIWVGATSHRVMVRMMKDRDASNAHSVIPLFRGLIFFGCIAAALGYLTLERTIAITGNPEYLARIILKDEDIVGRPDGLPSYEEAHFEDWMDRCKVQYPDKNCAAEFENIPFAEAWAWKEERNEKLSTASQPDWSVQNSRDEHTDVMDFRNANLQQAYVANVSLQNAQLDKASMVEVNLEGAKLIGAQLNGADLTRSSMESADLSNAKMRDAILYKASLSWADFSKADLQEVDLRFAGLKWATLVEAQLQKADLSNAKLQGANLQQANLQNARLRNADLKGAKLNAADLQNADMHRVKAQGADLSDAQLQGAVISSAQLQDADLSSAQMQGTNLRSSVLTGAKLNGANLEEADLQNAILKNADLPGARFTNGVLTEAVMNHATLTDAQMTGATLRYAQLNHATFHGADLTGADLRSAELENADLDTANLSATDLRHAKMRSANLGYSRMFGNADRMNNLLHADLSGSKNAGGALRFVDLSKAITDDATDWRNAFGDNSVIWFPNQPRPCQFEFSAHSEEEFYARWRGWLDLGPKSPTWASWDYIAPPEYRDVTPIPPPEGCTWKTEPLD